MSYVHRHLKLPRRTFLKGAGAAIALPWLDAMSPALTWREPEGPTRALFVFAPNGVKMDEWRPAQTGREFDLPRLLSPLAEHRPDFSVLSGLDLDNARSHGDGPGDHARASAAFLTCEHPVKTGGSDIRVGVSIDQVIAQEVGHQTPFPSLELGMERGRSAGACDSGYSCAYSNNIAWRTPTTPVAKEVDPRAVFRRLFGDPGGPDAEARAARRKRLRSVLDVVRADVSDLNGRLSSADRQKLDEYLTSVRELEQRLERAEREANEGPDVPVPEGLLDRGNYEHRLGLMYEMIALAFQTDATRTVTFMLGNAGSNISYRWLGIPEGHHNLSHHRGDEKKHAKIASINHYHVTQFARLLDRLKATEDAGQTMLDRAIIVYGSGIADGNRHAHVDLPILLCGHGNGALHPGQHMVSAKGTPLANLYLSLLGGIGIEREKFGDSTGALAGV